MFDQIEQRVILKFPNGSYQIEVFTKKEFMKFFDKHNYTMKEAIEKYLEIEIKRTTPIDSATGKPYEVELYTTTSAFHPNDRTYRRALRFNGQKFEIDLDHAKELHKQLIPEKIVERTPKDVFGQQDFTEAKKEMDDLIPKIETAKNMDELYNIWPKSIENRKSARKYKLRDRLRSMYTQRG